MGTTLTNKTHFYLGTTSPADTVSEFAADTYVEIEKVFDLGEFGDLAEGIEDQTLADDRVRRLKGSADGGTMDVIVTNDSDDEGQAALALAAKERDDVNVKIVLPDRKTPSGSGTTFYFRANVLGGRTSFGEADSVIRTTWSLAINSDRLEVPAS